MSRVAKSPITIPAGVSVELEDRLFKVKGPLGTLQHQVHPWVDVKEENDRLCLVPNKQRQDAWALAGTTRALLYNMVLGVSQGFERRLQLVGVGYRAQAQGNNLNLTLGFSFPVDYPVPKGVTIETPTQTEIQIKGIDKQQVGQVAANIRRLRPLEPYKGKGVRYTDEPVVLKEAKKK
ncbi:50S ribosomal protein L6 [Nitrococcus mobilis]|uniref:Large ribosomal subunit protein uL6 n=1 Tax=Nitrococcus mobilis Nb-231 TaxID=314278 RepID=A4BT33_9GAMM|nr:50S ribosomal protein L6 [Nitrococcus mobilis]EAR21101.1 Ribosomal protein L6 [Nitrococcus mobilis Nb-231]